MARRRSARRVRHLTVYLLKEEVVRDQGLLERLGQRRKGRLLGINALGEEVTDRLSLTGHLGRPPRCHAVQRGARPGGRSPDPPTPRSGASWSGGPSRATQAVANAPTTRTGRADATGVETPTADRAGPRPLCYPEAVSNRAGEAYPVSLKRSVPFAERDRAVIHNLGETSGGLWSG